MSLIKENSLFFIKSHSLQTKDVYPFSNFLEMCFSVFSFIRSKSIPEDSALSDFSD